MKVGQTVYIVRHIAGNGSVYSKQMITRETATQWVVGESKFNKKSLRLVNRDMYSTTRLEPQTPENDARYVQQELKEYVMWFKDKLYRTPVASLMPHIEKLKELEKELRKVKPDGSDRCW